MKYVILHVIMRSKNHCKTCMSNLLTFRYSYDVPPSKLHSKTLLKFIIQEDLCSYIWLVYFVNVMYKYPSINYKIFTIENIIHKSQ